MRYLGGKFREAKEFASILLEARKPKQLYIEPFLGGAWVLELVDNPREAYDINPYLIALYQAIQEGWQPPDKVSEQEYKEVLSGKQCPDFYKAFVGFGCSFGGKWFGGYGRSKTGRNYASETKRALMRLAPKLKGVKLACLDYRELKPNGAIIYCDPPYSDCTPYNGTKPFNNKTFWKVMEEWSKTNTVLVSEYIAPEGWTCIWEKRKNISVRLVPSNSHQPDDRIERLFYYAPN